MSTEVSLQGCFNSASNFDLSQRIGKALMASNVIPDKYQNNLPNVLVALEMAVRMNLSPLTVMQNLYIVHGMPGWSTKFVIAQVNTRGDYEPLEYEFRGEEGTDEWACRAYATHIKTGKVKTGSWVSIALAKSEGWYGKTGSKWKTIPEQMLYYRSAAFWARIHTPEATMGLSTVEELEDITIDTEFELVSSKVAAEGNKTSMGFVDPNPVTVMSKKEDPGTITPEPDKSAEVKPDEKKPEEKPDKKGDSKKDDAKAGLTPSTLFDDKAFSVHLDGRKQLANEDGSPKFEEDGVTPDYGAPF